MNIFYCYLLTSKVSPFTSNNSNNGIFLVILIMNLFTVLKTSTLFTGPCLQLRPLKNCVGLHQSEWSIIEHSALENIVIIAYDQPTKYMWMEWGNLNTCIQYERWKLVFFRFCYFQLNYYLAVPLSYRVLKITIYW